MRRHELGDPCSHEKLRPVGDRLSTGWSLPEEANSQLPGIGQLCRHQISGRLSGSCNQGVITSMQLEGIPSPAEDCLPANQYFRSQQCCSTAHWLSIPAECRRSTLIERSAELLHIGGELPLSGNCWAASRSRQPLSRCRGSVICEAPVSAENFASSLASSGGAHDWQR